MASDYEDRLREAERILNEGGSYHEAEKATRISHSRLARRFPGKGRWTHVDEEDFARFLELQKRGLSAAAIGAEIGRSARTVVRWRQRAGLSGYPGIPFTDEEMALARRLLEDGASYEDVGRTLGRYSNTIKRRLPGYGWSKEECLDYARMLRNHGGVLRRIA